jgi:tRNA threonylcarbamoyladenosine modification (KEOPS) complex  Pcc1 subunit
VTSGAGEWSARVRVVGLDAPIAVMLERALRPEAEREVPRARAELRRPEPRTVELSITARDVGAMRAALNTYLGWVSLSLATLRAASVGGPA